MVKEISIMLASPEVSTSEYVESLLNRDEMGNGYYICAKADNPVDTLNLADRLMPDVIFLDVADDFYNKEWLFLIDRLMLLDKRPLLVLMTFSGYWSLIDYAEEAAVWHGRPVMVATPRGGYLSLKDNSFKGDACLSVPVGQSDLLDTLSRCRRIIDARTYH